MWHWARGKLQPPVKDTVPGVTSCLAALQGAFCASILNPLKIVPNPPPQSWGLTAIETPQTPHIIMGQGPQEITKPSSVTH